MKGKRILSIVLAVAMMLSTIGVMADGTEGLITEINSVEDFIAFANAVNNGNNYSGETVTLKADLDLAEIDWTPIGSNSKAFSGTFDGDNHTITNLTIETSISSDSGSGLFGSVNGGTIKNLKIDGANVGNVNLATPTVGGTAVVVGTTAYGGDIDNVHVSNATVVANSYVAAIVGYASGSVTNCSATNINVTANVILDGEVYDKGDKVGGIVGYCNEAITIEGNKLCGTNKLTGYRDIGGIAGCVNSATTIKTNNVEGSIEIVVDQSATPYDEAPRATNAGAVIGREASEPAESTENNSSATVNVSEIYPIMIGNTPYFTMKDALNNVGAGDVVIDLNGDVELSYAAREAYGTAETTSITINGNGNTLYLNQTDSDWSSIGMANTEGTFKLNNVNVEKTGKYKDGGAWNTHAMQFNVNVEFTDVDFNGSIKLGGAKSVLTNVDIVEDQEYYAIWIEADGQNVEISGGSITATNGGRGIKIGDEYVEDEAAKVTLGVSDMTFETAKKAAIIVTTNEGADITVNDINIENVAADSENAVWIDEKCAEAQDKVTVTGAEMTVEDAVAMVNGKLYPSVQRAVNAANDGDIVKLFAGTYGGGADFNISKNITLQGTLGENGEHLTIIEEGIKGTGIGYYDYAVKMNDGALKDIAIKNVWKAFITESIGDFTFDNVKIEGAMYGIHIAEARNGTVVVKNCDIDAQWANSFASGIDTLIIQDNIFRGNDAYYGNDGAAGVNTYSANTTIKNNIFKENARILLNSKDAGDKVKFENNYFEDVSKVLFGGGDNYPVYDSYFPANSFLPVYLDEDKTALSNVNVINKKSVANITVDITSLYQEIKNDELSDNVAYEVNVTTTTPETAYAADEGLSVEYYDISLLRNGKAYTPTKSHKVDVTLGSVISGEVAVKHWNGSAWEDITATTTDNVVSFVTDSFSPFAFVYSAGTVAEADIAAKINVSLEKVSDNTYDIVLTGTDETGVDKIINRFMSAEFTFDLVSDTLAYEIVKNGYVNIKYPETGSELYEFNLNGTNVPDITGNKITVATVVFEGYGEGTFSIVGDNNVVHTAEVSDNIVDTFNTTTLANLDLTAAKDIAVKLEVPTQLLTVEVDFPNAITDNAAAYQDMTITISGGDLKSDIVYDLGTDGDAGLADGKYTTKTELTKNTTYVVTVKGAGYRTARATVTMTEDKAVTFWNNVKDVEGANYLAGDIVKDNTINLYDLSAVVSYFGTNNTVTAKSDYAKYDLNRDGKIDSKDVAYVLVSWGK